jgi:hypothetical protein
VASASSKTGRRPHWATRQEAMAHARVGATKMNEWLHDRDSGIVAKKVGAKVLIDLNSIDDKINAAPDAADSQPSHYPHHYKQKEMKR